MSEKLPDRIYLLVHSDGSEWQVDSIHATADAAVRACNQDRKGHWDEQRVEVWWLDQGDEGDVEREPYWRVSWWWDGPGAWTKAGNVAVAAFKAEKAGKIQQDRIFEEDDRLGDFYVYAPDKATAIRVATERRKEERAKWLRAKRDANAEKKA